MLACRSARLGSCARKLTRAQLPHVARARLASVPARTPERTAELERLAEEHNGFLFGEVVRSAWRPKPLHYRHWNGQMHLRSNPLGTLRCRSLRLKGRNASRRTGSTTSPR